jgi:transcription elongation factor GreA
MTPNGLSQLQKELQRLLTEERPLVIEEISRARQHGDLSENAEYDAAKEKQRHIEGRIRQMEHKISHANVIDVASLSGPKIVFGATVTLRDENTDDVLCYQIVGVDEADLEQCKIAIDSALARELIGKEEGATIEFVTPRGEKHYFVEKVVYDPHFDGRIANK